MRTDAATTTQPKAPLPSQQILRAGYVLAMRLLQSDLVLDDEERDAADMFVRRYWDA